MRIDATYSVSLTLGTVDTIRGTDFQTRNLLFALAAGEPHRIARAFLLEGSFRALPGPSARARAEDLLTRSEKLAHQLDHPHLTAWTRLSRGYINFLWGRFSEGMSYFLDAETRFREQCATSLRARQHQALHVVVALLPRAGGRGHGAAPAPIADADSRGDVSAGANSARASRICAARQTMIQCARRRRPRRRCGAWSQGFLRAALLWNSMRRRRPISTRAAGRGAVDGVVARAGKIAALSRAVHPRRGVAPARPRVATGKSTDRGARRRQGDREDGSSGRPLADLILAAAEPRDRLALLDRAIAGFERNQLALYAAAAQRQRALLRGDEPADFPPFRSWARMADALAPGFAR